MTARQNTGGKRWMTPAQVIEEKLPSFTLWWLYQRLRAGDIRGSLIGRKWLIEESAIDEFLEAHSNTLARRRRQRSATG